MHDSGFCFLQRLQSQVSAKIFTAWPLDRAWTTHAKVAHLHGEQVDSAHWQRPPPCPARPLRVAWWGLDSNKHLTSRESDRESQGDAASFTTQHRKSVSSASVMRTGHKSQPRRAWKRLASATQRHHPARRECRVESICISVSACRWNVRSDAVLLSFSAELERRASHPSFMKNP